MKWTYFKYDKDNNAWLSESLPLDGEEVWIKDGDKEWPDEYYINEEFNTPELESENRLHVGMAWRSRIELAQVIDILKDMKNQEEAYVNRFSSYAIYAVSVTKARNRYVALEEAINCVETCMNEANRIKHQEVGDL